MTSPESRSRGAIPRPVGGLGRQGAWRDHPVLGVGPGHEAGGAEAGLRAVAAGHRRRAEHREGRLGGRGPLARAADLRDRRRVDDGRDRAPARHGRRAGHRGGGGVPREHRARGVAAELGEVGAHVAHPVAVEPRRVVGGAGRRPAVADGHDRHSAVAEVERAAEVLRRGADALGPGGVGDPRPHAERVVDALRGAVGAEARLGAADRDQEPRVHPDRLRLGHEDGAQAGQGAELGRQVAVDARGLRGGVALDLGDDLVGALDPGREGGGGGARDGRLVGGVGQAHERAVRCGVLGRRERLGRVLVLSGSGGVRRLRDMAGRQPGLEPQQLRLLAHQPALDALQLVALGPAEAVGGGARGGQLGRRAVDSARAWASSVAVDADATAGPTARGAIKAIARPHPRALRRRGAGRHPPSPTVSASRGYLLRARDVGEIRSGAPISAHLGRPRRRRRPRPPDPPVETGRQSQFDGAPPVVHSTARCRPIGSGWRSRSDGPPASSKWAMSTRPIETADLRVSRRVRREPRSRGPRRVGQSNGIQERPWTQAGSWHPSIGGECRPMETRGQSQLDRGGHGPSRAGPAVTLPVHPRWGGGAPGRLDQGRTAPT